MRGSTCGGPEMTVGRRVGAPFPTIVVATGAPFTLTVGVAVAVAADAIMLKSGACGLRVGNSVIK